jgi:hypothetical protein
LLKLIPVWPEAVTSPLDLLDGLQQDEVQAAAEATRRLQGQRMLAS